MSKAIENEDKVVIMTVEEETKMTKVKKFVKKVAKPVGKVALIGAAIVGAYAIGQKSKSKTEAVGCDDDCEDEYLEDAYEVEDYE